jgi:hypothetical protein
MLALLGFYVSPFGLVNRPSNYGPTIITCTSRFEYCTKPQNRALGTYASSYSRGDSIMYIYRTLFAYSAPHPPPADARPYKTSYTLCSSHRSASHYASILYVLNFLFEIEQAFRSCACAKVKGTCRSHDKRVVYAAALALATTESSIVKQWSQE